MFSLISILFLQFFIFVSNQSSITLHLIVFFQSLTILFSSFDLPVYWFRYKSKAQTVAGIRLIAFFISAFWRIFAVSVFKDIVLYVIAATLETLFFAFLLILIFVKQNKENPIRFSFSIFKSMIKISYPFIFSAVLSSIYGQTDKVMLKFMIDNSAVATYSVSLTLAGAIVIIPSALIEGFRPQIMMFKTTNRQMYLVRLKQLYALVFWICFSYCLFITLFAKWIILFFYGTKYISAVPSLSLIVWYTSFSYFGAINNLYMVAEEKTKWVQVTAFFGAILNIILNFVFIPFLGISGAALASLITQVVANFFLLLLISPLRENFFIICSAICLRGLRNK